MTLGLSSCAPRFGSLVISAADPPTANNQWFKREPWQSGEDLAFAYPAKVISARQDEQEGRKAGGIYIEKGRSVREIKGAALVGESQVLEGISKQLALVEAEQIEAAKKGIKAVAAQLTTLAEGLENSPKSLLGASQTIEEAIGKLKRLRYDNLYEKQLIYDKKGPQFLNIPDLNRQLKERIPEILDGIQPNKLRAWLKAKQMNISTEELLGQIRNVLENPQGNWGLGTGTSGYNKLQFEN